MQGLSQLDARPLPFGKLLKLLSRTISLCGNLPPAMSFKPTLVINVKITRLLSLFALFTEFLF